MIFLVENQIALGEVYLDEINSYLLVGTLMRRKCEGVLRTVLYEYNGNTTSENSQEMVGTTFVNDYAISGGWNYNGEALIICDAAGGIYF